MNIDRWSRARFCVLALWASLLCPRVAGAADAPAQVFRVGYLDTLPPIPSVGPGRLPIELAKLGYVEGKHVAYEVRYTGGDSARLPEMAAELVKLKVDVIFAVGLAVAATKAATSEIPIVGWGMHGAVQSGLVSNLRHPGSNLTGTDSLAPDLDAKRMQLLKQILPGLDRLAVVFDPADLGTSAHLKAIADAQQSLGLTTSNLPISRAAELDAVLATAAGKPLGAVFTLTSTLTFLGWHRIHDFAQKQRLPTLCEFREMVQAGCLLSYGPTFDEITQRSAAQIDKILRGTPPGDIPIERPTRFELVINLKTARALGLTVPQELLLRADALIE
jgi:putative ABC transport system substrate-binding protein